MTARETYDALAALVSRCEEDEDLADQLRNVMDVVWHRRLADGDRADLSSGIDPAPRATPADATVATKESVAVVEPTLDLAVARASLTEANDGVFDLSAREMRILLNRASVALGGVDPPVEPIGSAGMEAGHVGHRAGCVCALCKVARMACGGCGLPADEGDHVLCAAAQRCSCGSTEKHLAPSGVISCSVCLRPIPGAPYVAPAPPVAPKCETLICVCQFPRNRCPDCDTPDCPACAVRRVDAMKPAREAIICDDGPFGRAANDASIATLTRERDAARAARQAAEGDLLAATRNEQRTLAWVIALQKQFPDFAAWSASAAALSAWAAERKETP